MLLKWRVNGHDMRGEARTDGSSTHSSASTKQIAAVRASFQDVADPASYIVEKPRRYLGIVCVFRLVSHPDRLTPFQQDD